MNPSPAAMPPAKSRFIERRFLMPSMVIAVATVFVPLGYLSGDAWAALAGALTSGYMGMAGYTHVGTIKAQNQPIVTQPQVTQNQPNITKYT